MTNMTSDNPTAGAEIQAPNERQDDFDMAKLKKSLTQEQRKSLVSKQKVAKLTPAEIRSLNHNAGLSRPGSARAVDNQSTHRLTSSTISPPLSPDNQSPTRSLSVKQASSSNLPTPPQSPDHEGRGPGSSARHIHAPKPVSHAQAVNLSGVGSLSRPSSATSYRGIATYRGPEITRNGSLTMLQHPSQNIVSNPLSQFSRPRQSTLTTSPNKASSESRLSEDPVGRASMKGRSLSIASVNQNPSREHSPVRLADSPVSIDDGEDRESAGVTPNVSDQINGKHATPEIPSKAVKEQQRVAAVPKQKSSWRKTLTGSFDAESTPLRKEYRRRSLIAPRNGQVLHAIPYADTKPGEPPKLRASLKDELPSTKTSVFKNEGNDATEETEYGQHPAVRPLSTDVDRSVFTGSDSSPSSSRKGKERQSDSFIDEDKDTDTISMASSVPSYSRCSCCGRVQKPGGFESDLSPVLENENLRTNFSFEAERMSSDHNRRMSWSNEGPRKYTPIIPMEVGNETKQARIEPRHLTTPSITSPTSSNMPPGIVNKLGDVIGPSSTPLAIMPPSKITHKFVRFGSLHARKDDHSEEREKQQEKGQTLTPPAAPQRFGSLYGMRVESQPNQQQQQQQQPSQSQSAYQAQQAKRFPPTNGHHPLRSSHLAYEEDGNSASRNRDLPQSGSLASAGAAESPLGDSPSSPHGSVPEPPSDSLQYGDNSDGPMVDLSSFDGSSVQGSLARSATLIRPLSSPQSYHIATTGEPSASVMSARSPTSALPATTSSNTSIAPSHSSDSDSAVGISMTSPRPTSGLPASTSLGDSATLPPKTLSTSNMVPNPLENPSANNADVDVDADSSSLRTTGSSTSTTMTTATAIATSTTMYKPGTIVKMLPTQAVSTPTSPSSTNSKGQVKLGDWVLPKTPLKSAPGNLSEASNSMREREVKTEVAAA